MGGYATPQIRDAVLRSGERGLAQQAGMETRAGQYDVNRQNMAQNLALAGLTRGENQTGTSTGQGKIQQKDPWGAAAGLAGGLAPISL